MDRVETLVLLRNLIKRIQRQEDGSGTLSGIVTQDEVEALEAVVASFSTQSGDITPEQPQSSLPSDLAAFPEAKGTTGNRVSLDISAQSAPRPTDEARLCLDFGTAMSKATLVIDESDDREEEIHVLSLGIPGDQQHVSEDMLLSSVYISNDGILRFGHAAYEKSILEGGDGSRQRLDNIKRRLSEDGWNQRPSEAYNPTGLNITYGDLVLAYMTFLTWTIGQCLEERGLGPYISRRFALPSLGGQKNREAVSRLRRLVGEAQVLADTFGRDLRDGLPLAKFIEAMKALQRHPAEYGFVDQEVAEPLGVAGSMVSWKSPVDSMVLVVDVGAGTSDFGLFRIHVNPEGHSEGLEAEGSSRCVTEAGDYLDRILVEVILRKAEIKSDHPRSNNVRRRLSLRIREFKETMFSEGEVFVPLDEPGLKGDVTIAVEEFMREDAVRRFSETLHKQMVDILSKADGSWAGWVQARPERKLIVALTGGGAELPMVQKLAQSPLLVNGRELDVAAAQMPPRWLVSLDENIERDYGRVAVSLGGARRRLMELKRASITGGDVGSPVIGGYYQKGQ